MKVILYYWVTLEDEFIHLLCGFDVHENRSLTELRRGQSPQKGHLPIKFISPPVLNLLTAINLPVLCGHSIYGAKNLLNGPWKFLLKIHSITTMQQWQLGTQLVHLNNS